MVININATVVSDKLALADVYTYFNKAYPDTWTQKEIRDFVHSNAPLPEIKGFNNARIKGAPTVAFVNTLYQKKHDYYFEILTNMQL